MISVIPSIASCNPLAIAGQIDLLNNYGSLHIDIEDGNFVPNITFGMKTIASIRAYTSLPLNVHLMVSNPCEYLSDLIQIEPTDIIVHVESLAYPLAFLNRVKSQGISAGLALNFSTPVASLLPFKESLSSILIMTSEPDNQGQLFCRSSLDRIKEARSLFPACSIWVDGGISEKHLSEVISAGADHVIMGRAIWQSPDPKETIKAFERWGVE